MSALDRRALDIVNRAAAEILRQRAEIARLRSANRFLFVCWLVLLGCVAFQIIFGLIS